jgi:hypothetical protein
MTGITPALEIPYTEDGDVRAIHPATMQAQSERLEELILPYHAYGTVIGHGATPAGTTADVALSADPPGAFSEAGGIITYLGPNRRFLVTALVTLGAGEALKSTVNIGDGSDPIRSSIISTGVGPDGQATHTHYLSVVLLLGPDYTTTIGVGTIADTVSAATVACDVHLDLVAL